MGNVAEVYVKGLHKQTKFYYAQWLPNSKTEIVTVGEIVDDYFFRPISTLADLGMSFSRNNRKSIRRRGHTQEIRESFRQTSH